MWRWRDRLYPMAGQCCALRAARCPSGRSAWTLPLLPRPACTAGARAPDLPGTRRGTFYLYQPKDILLGHLASELHQHATPPPSTEAAPEPAERRVRYSAIQTPPTCSRGSTEPLGPLRSADSARPSRLRFPPATPLGWDDRPWTSARRGSPASETAGLDVLHRWPDAEPGGVRVLTGGVGQRTGDHRTQ